MDGGLVPLGGTIHDVLAVVLANLRTNPKGPLVTWFAVRLPGRGARSISSTRERVPAGTSRTTMT